MEFKAAIDALKKLEGGADLASAIEAHVSKLDDKIYTVIGESRTKGTKAQTYEGVLGAIAKLLGIEGDLESALTNLETKLKSVVDEGKAAQTKLTETETRATTAEDKLKTFERQGKISEIAAKAGANAKALEKLLGDRLDELKVEGEAVKLGDKTLREFIEADETLKDFMPALFPAQQAGQKTEQRQPAGKLPSGSPNSGDAKEERAGRSYLNSIYGKTAELLTGKTAAKN